jgi:hypothetical protein
MKGIGKIINQPKKVGTQSVFLLKNLDIRNDLRNQKSIFAVNIHIMGLKLTNIRKNYLKSKLLEENLPELPFGLFEKWYQEALDNEEDEPNAMVLSTVYQQRPSARVVLLKEMTDQRFLFFTNYSSRKGFEINLNPFVALTFYWPKCERQIRIEGMLEKTTEEMSEELLRRELDPNYAAQKKREMREKKLKRIYGEEI